MMPHFWAGLAAAGCKPEEIGLLVLTHAHFDHIGAAGRLKKLTSVPILIHKIDAPILAEGRFVVSDGFRAGAKVKAFVGRHLLNKAYVSFDPVVPDILVEGEMRLDEYGFPVSVVPTPGHTDSSIAVLTDDGGLFAGDTVVVNRRCDGMWRYMSHYGTSQERIRHTWRMLLDRGVKHIYPGHGRDFRAAELAEFC